MEDVDTDIPGGDTATLENNSGETLAAAHSACRSMS